MFNLLAILLHFKGFIFVCETYERKKLRKKQMFLMIDLIIKITRHG